MTVLQDITNADVAAQAAVTAEVLSLGLPVPVLVSLHAHVGRDTSVVSVGLQFAGFGNVDAVRAWAAHFGAEVVTRPASNDPGTVWIRSYFTCSGFQFEAYTWQCTAPADDPDDPDE